MTHDKTKQIISLAGSSISIALLSLLGDSSFASSQERTTSTPPSVRVVVNSNADGEVQPDNGLTLREAIALVNGTLPTDRLSAAERGQVESLSGGVSRIEFNLPANATTIRLTEVLPPLAVPVVVDGTTQPGYDKTTAFFPGNKEGVGEGGSGRVGEILVGNVNSPGTCPSFRWLAAEEGNKQLAGAGYPRPIVALTPAPGQEVFRGLSVTSDGVTIRGLSLYGFTSRHRATASTPPGDIFISHRLPPPNTGRQQPPAASFPFRRRDVPPKDVVIESNWLGIPPLGERGPDGRPIRIFSRQKPPVFEDPAPPTPSESVSRSTFRPLINFFDRYLSTRPAILPRTSAFGVYVFNSLGSTIRRNIIANHDASGIITAVRADNLLIQENVLECNGFAGMPDAIRLEGVVENAQIVANQIRDNAGSGIYMFKSNGAVQIRDNTLEFNGRRYRRAAIYLMGDEHQVVGNRISNQPGPGVAVAAFPASDRNVITGNQFANLRGLSIDTVTQLNTDVHAYAVGDGPNPRMQSHQDRRQTGNFGIDAPRFVSREFFRSQGDGSVTLIGKAAPGATIEIYQVTENTNTRGPLNRAIAKAEVSPEGEFSVTVPNIEAGERVSAIATHPRFGTSEPALNVLIRPFPSN